MPHFDKISKGEKGRKVQCARFWSGFGELTTWRGKGRENVGLVECEGMRFYGGRTNIPAI